MFQLRYNDKFDELEEVIPHWNSIEDIPSNIMNFIKNKRDTRVILEGTTGYCYCQKCMDRLYEDLYCSKCNIKYDENYFIVVDDIRKNSGSNFDYFYIFSLVGNQVLLCELCLETYLFNANVYKPNLVNKLDISKVFYVKENGLIDLMNNRFYDYNSYKNDCHREDKIDSINNLKGDYGYLYVDNLDELRKTIYKYSYIWECKEYFLEKEVNIVKLTYIPICNKSFEYLVKYGLYNLAYSDIEFKGNFIKTFGVSKEYLNFMKEYNICYTELLVLQAIKVKDIGLIKKLEYYCYVISKLKNEFNINILKLIDYFDNKKYNYDYLFEYYDYIKAAYEIGLNIKDKRVRYPDNLLEEHNKVCIKYDILKDPDIDNKIKIIANKYDVNKYDDGEYVIFPADSLKSFYDEGSQQNNCVSSYYQDYIDGNCQIYFMREKNNINKSLVTIEVQDGKVVQARIKNNDLPDDKLMKVIKRWEKIIK